MVLQYSTMMAERRASLLVDNISSLVEGLAGVAVKVCKPQVAAGLSSRHNTSRCNMSRSRSIKNSRRQQQVKFVQACCV